MKDKFDALIDACLDWWEEHEWDKEYDCSEPEFVEIAQDLEYKHVRNIIRYLPVIKMIEELEEEIDPDMPDAMIWGFVSDDFRNGHTLGVQTGARKFLERLKKMLENYK